MILAKSHACILVAVAAAIGAGIASSSSPKVVEKLQKSAEPTSAVASFPASTTLLTPTESADVLVARKLKLGPVGIRIQLPKSAVEKSCARAVWDSPGHETCILSDALPTSLLVAVSSAVGREIFVPQSWHDHAVAQVEQTPVVDRNEELRSIFEKTFATGLLETDFLGQDKIEGAFGIIGRVDHISAAGISLSSVYCSVAFGLAGNRGTQLLFCSSDKQKVLHGIVTAMRSLRELNPSIEYKRRSFMEREHDAFVAKLNASSVADKQAIADEEKSYESLASAACAGSAILSVEYYQCRETKAEMHLGELKMARIAAVATPVQSEPEAKPVEETKAGLLEGGAQQ